MAISAKLYGKFPENLGGGNNIGDSPMDLLSDSLRLTLHANTYTPNQNTDELKATATGELTTTGGYTALGQALASKSYVAASLITTFDAADITWTSTTITHRYGVIWDDTIATPADPLIMYVDNGGDVSTASTDLVYQWNVSGIFTFAVS